MKMTSIAVVPRAVALFGFWILMWGEWSAANVVSGLIIVPAVSWLFGHQQPARYSLRPLGALRLLGFVLYSLILGWR